MLTFYIIVVTQTLSLIGSRMTNISVGIWVFTNTGDVTPLLLTAFFTELPGMLFGSLTGVLIDRWDRRHVMMLSDAGQAAGTFLLFTSFFSGQFQLWHLYSITIFQGSFAIFQEPAKDAATTMLVPLKHRERANAIQQMAFPLAGSIAPVLAGVFYAFIGITGVILIDLSTFGVAVLVMLLIKIPRPKQTEEGRLAKGNAFQEMLAGFRFLRTHRVLFGFVLYWTFINFLLNGPLELAIPYLLGVTGSESTTGTIMGFMSFGAFTGAAIIAVWGGTRPRMRTLLPGLILTGAMFLMYGTVRSPMLLGLSIFLLMIPLPMANALFISILQVKTPPDMQGRIFSMVSQMGFVGATASFLLTGPLVDHVLEPAMAHPSWQIVSPIVGQAPGSEIGLLLMVTGFLVLAATSSVYAFTQIPSMERILPDYEALAEE